MSSLEQASGKRAEVLASRLPQGANAMAHYVQGL